MNYFILNFACKFFVIAGMTTVETRRLGLSPSLGGGEDEPPPTEN